MTEVGIPATPFARPDARPREEPCPDPDRPPDARPGRPPARPLAVPARHSLADLYVQHRLFHTRLAYLLVGDRETAEDVVQDAFAALYRRFGEYIENVDHVLGYLRTVVLNAARDALRRRKSADRHVPPHATDVMSAEAEVLETEERRRVALALRRLPTRQREVVVLRYWAGLSEAEIATAMGISKGTVKSTASRALAALKQIMEAEG